MPPSRVRASASCYLGFPHKWYSPRHTREAGSRQDRFARTALSAAGHCILPAVDAALHRAVETSLTAAWRGAVRLGRDDGDGIEGKPYVRRLHVESAPADTPPSVVVKRPRLADGETFDARSERPETTKFFTEWACLQLLNEIGVDAAPRFYSGDVEQGFLVMEDLGPGDRLDHALLGDDPVHARRTLVALLQTVGRMHAATIGKRGRFAEILGGLGRKMSRPDESAEAQRDAAIADTFSRLAIDPPRTFFDEMIDITRRSFAAYDVDALLHGDPCPDNCHWVGDRVRLLDFEHSRFGNAFFDTAIRASTSRRAGASVACRPTSWTTR